MPNQSCYRPSPSRLEPEEFLVIQTAADKSLSGLPPTAPGAIPAPSGIQMSQSGRGGSVVCVYLHYALQKHIGSLKKI